MNSPWYGENSKLSKVLIGVPILAWTHEFATSFLEFWTDLLTVSDPLRRFHVAYKFKYRRPVQLAEEEIVDLAIQSECTHVLLMDDDIYDITSKDLFTLIDADKDVIGGIMHASGHPYSMCAFRRYNLDTRVIDQPILKGPARLYEIPEDQRVGIQEADLIPFGFTLIKTEVFKNLKKPWFKCDTKAPTDSFFCDSVLDAGIKVHAHFDVWLNHRGVTKHNRHIYSQLAMANMQAKGDGQIVTITEEQMRINEALLAVKLEQAEAERKRREVTKLNFKEPITVGKEMVS